MYNEHELDRETIDTDAGEYTVQWIYDESPEQPYDCGFCLFTDGGRDYIDISHEADKLPALVESAIRAHGNDSWNYQLHSGAAIVRYMRLKGFLGVTLVDERYRPEEPTTDRNERICGIAWENSEISGQWDETMARNNVKGDLAEWHAWAEGDTFGWVVTDPNGAPVADCWGYYGLDHNREWTLSEAKSEAEYDANQRIAQANLVGSGIVGLV